MDAQHVVHRYVLCYRHDKRYFCLDGLDDCLCGEFGGHKYGTHMRVDLLHCLDEAKNWLVFCFTLQYERYRTSFTESKTGRSRCVWPPFPGETPPTMLVPYAIVSFAFDVACEHVRSCTSSRVSCRTALPVKPTFGVS